MYIFDTASFADLFRFYPKRFPSLWREFNSLVEASKIISVKEVLKEIKGRNDSLCEWAIKNSQLFQEPSTEEAIFVSEIFQAPNFQQSLEAKKLLKGGAFADPFVIAKAKILSGTVVTQEKLKPNSSKIPNICRHFGVKCIDLEALMEEEGWEF
ncbi:MAG: DUF4411 family protein [Proteobacteria bacterium]|nr:DUF4411 family protein [Pseudomonadota bacterium]